MTVACGQFCRNLFLLHLKAKLITLTHNNYATFATIHKAIEILQYTRFTLVMAAHSSKRSTARLKASWDDEHACELESK